MTPGQTRLLRVGADSLGIALTPDSIGRLDRFLGVLDFWGQRIRLTGERDLDAIIRKHVVDSLAPLARLPPTGLLIDVGSGAGFPGIVLACVRPDQSLVLIESRRRRASFLREVIRSVPLPQARVLEGRAEAATSTAELGCRAAAVIARALRPNVLFASATQLLAPQGVVVAMQTPRTAASALAAARCHGFALTARHDYALAAGEQRTLLVLARGDRA
jgi:16S rRNA (guanine527-N7)-methyltransferase